MNKLRILALVGLLVFSVFAISTASAYHYGTSEPSNYVIYLEDIKGGARGFSLERSGDFSGRTTGYYDRSYRRDSYRASDNRLALEAFKTFQLDSKDQNKLELEKERNKHRLKMEKERNRSRLELEKERNRDRNRGFYVGYRYSPRSYSYGSFGGYGSYSRY